MLYESGSNSVIEYLNSIKEGKKNKAKIMIGKETAVSHISQNVGTVVFVLMHSFVFYTITECSWFCLNPSWSLSGLV